MAVGCGVGPALARIGRAVASPFRYRDFWASGNDDFYKPLPGIIPRLDYTRSLMLTLQSIQQRYAREVALCPE